MSKQWYGNVSNRIEEGHVYGTDKTIKEGMDITIYYWSDRACYFITKVIDQKHIFVNRYHVCADLSKEGGMGHQNWLYFRTLKEHNQYLNGYFPKHEYNLNPQEDTPEEWVFRYNSWKRVSRGTLALYNKVKAQEGFVNARFTDKEMERLNAGEEVIKYYNLSGKVSFGVRSYYYDWEY